MMKRQLAHTCTTSVHCCAQKNELCYAVYRLLKRAGYMCKQELITSSFPVRVALNPLMLLLQAQSPPQCHSPPFSPQGFPYPLDCFQKEALQHLLDGMSVVVCAPTGAGKTAIAEAAAAATLARGLRVVYTTPLKVHFRGLVLHWVSLKGW